MFRKHRTSTFAALLSLSITPSFCHAQQQAASSNFPVSISVLDRTRIDTWQWFQAPPKSETYSYVESLVRIGVTQHIRQWDWELELSQPSVLGLPNDAVSSVAAQGQLGLGGTYYAANSNNTEPAAAFLKQAFLRYHFEGSDKTIRLGRFEFVDGQETTPKNPAIAALQASRITDRLIGNFGFSNAQRSYDGIDGHYGRGSWDLTAMAGRVDQGVFNMNGNPELNVDFQYLAASQSVARQHIVWRAFAIGYHDGRTGLTKTDNRALAVRSTDHRNIRIGTYGGDLLASAPLGRGTADFLFWGALQNGSWGPQTHRGNAVALEGGYRFGRSATAPWLRGGWFRGSGDENPADNEHHTFFQLLPTPRIYARIPFYNLMNNTDGFVQVMEKPVKRVALRSDLHWLQLTSGKDLWYQGGGAFDNKVFGYVGRPGNGYSSFASIADISADWQATKDLAVNFYYGHVWGKSAIGKIYPADRNLQYGYVEFVYHWSKAQGSK